MTSPWQLKDGTATAALKTGVFLSMNPVQPTEAVQLGKRDGDQWHVFAIKPSPHFSFVPEEVYVRESDLIVRFRQSESDQFALQLNWRVVELEDDNIVCIELWASIQTDLLDTHPIVIVSCNSPAGGQWEIKNHGELHGPNESVPGHSESPSGDLPAALIAESGASVGVWMIERTDQQDAELMVSSIAGQKEVELFGHFMEKGVIRRARMRFYAVSGELADAKLRELYHEFCASPLPLTA